MIKNKVKEQAVEILQTPVFQQLAIGLALIVGGYLFRSYTDSKEEKRISLLEKKKVTETLPELTKLLYILNDAFYPYFGNFYIPDGTDEDKVIDTVTIISAKGYKAHIVNQAYRKLFGYDLYDVLKDELNSELLQKVMDILNNYQEDGNVKDAVVVDTFLGTDLYKYQNQRFEKISEVSDDTYIGWFTGHTVQGMAQVKVSLNSNLYQFFIEKDSVKFIDVNDFNRSSFDELTPQSKRDIITKS